MNIKKDTINGICPHARRCGGCRMKSSVYASALRKKQQELTRHLSRFGHVERIVPSPSVTEYRNKVQAAFFARGGVTLSGLYQSSDKRILQVEHCALQKSSADEIILTLRKLCQSFKLKPYDIKSGKGYLRHVLVRHAEGTGEVMVVLVTAEGELVSARSLVNELVRRHGEITTVVHNINRSKTPLYLGEESRVLYGDGYITDRLCGLEFRISPRSFYQINYGCAELLYKKVAELANVKAGERVLDAYCGTGTIGLCVAAGGVGALVGVELSPDAVSDAIHNAERNGIENARFVCADAGSFISDAAQAGERYDVVITDPPRAGCSRELLSALLTLAPERVVYVSCAPDTLARDLGYLTKNGYKVEKLQGFDMFPFTEHIECVALLERRSDINS